MNNIQTSLRLIKDHKLSAHPEGGWFVVLHVSDDKISSPYAKGDRERVLCSVIYYLLAPEALTLPEPSEDARRPSRHRNHAGYFHTNNSTTVHTWHAGKAVYTLIKRREADGDADATSTVEPEVKRVVIGDDVEAGETRVLVVPPAWWKSSETLTSDGYCLISETVTPGWVPEDHAFLTVDELRALFQNDAAALKEYEDHVLPTGHQLEFQ